MTWKLSFFLLLAVALLCATWAEWSHRNTTAQIAAERKQHSQTESAYRTQIQDLQGRLDTLEHLGPIRGIPTCPIAAIIPRVGSNARAWGNAVEVDYNGGATIFYCQPITPSPSPREVH